MSGAMVLERPVRMVSDKTRGGIVIAAGGTGGHLTPAAALADELFARGYVVTLMSDARSAALAADLFASHRRFVLPGKGVAGRNLARAASGVFSLGAAAWRARALMARDIPAAVIGFGSYPSVGPVLATRLFGRRPKVVLHEQNAVLGGANRMLARFADVVALSQSPTARVPAGTRTVVTGNPVRAAIAARAGAQYVQPSNEMRLLVIGGSLGARVLSDVVPAALASLPEPMRRRLRVTQQCRAEDLARVRAAYDAAGIAADLGSYFSDVDRLLAESHLVVARSGASTVAELGVIGRPAILVPLPGAVDGDQRRNAEVFAAGGGGWMFAQSDFSPAALASRLVSLFDHPALLANAAVQASALGRADAAAALADVVERAIGLERGA